MAIIHRGGQYHSAMPLVSGERINLIVWLHGTYGVVRVAPHTPEDQTTAATRWGDRLPAPPLGPGQAEARRPTETGDHAEL